MRFLKPLTFLILGIMLAFTGRAMAQQQKPFTQEQVSKMVQAGLGDDSGSKLIEQRGIDFTPTEDIVQSLKAAGASEAFLNALRAAKASEPASAKKPINQVQVFALLVGQVPSHRVSMLVHERGIDFEPTDDYLQEVRLAGGEDELVTALKGAKVTKPLTIPPPAQAQQSEVQQHVAYGAELAKKGQYAQAEKEFRTAVDLQPENAETHYLLGNILFQQQNQLGAQEEFLEAVRLKPDFALAHRAIGVVAISLGDKQKAFRECQKAYVLDSREPLIREAYVQALVDSWPSLIISSDGPLPTTWSDVWGFYVKLSTNSGWVDVFDFQCAGVLEVGNGRIKYSCPRAKYNFDAALSDVKDSRILTVGYGYVLISLGKAKKTRTFEFEATDRLGGRELPAPLLDAILQAKGK